MCDNSYHVYPVDDLAEHELEGDGCPCGPRIENYCGARIVVHNAWDGREMAEYLEAIKKDLIQ